jgi:hypothetical protein
MSESRLSVRYHDAEWIIQRERVINDGILQRERRRKKKRGGSKPIEIIGDIPEPTPQEITDARAVLAGIAAGMNATPDELRQVLDLLGLLPEAKLLTTYTQMGVRRAARAVCPHCRRPCIELLVDGRFRSHTTHPGVRKLNDDTRCPGSGQPSRPERATA